MPETIGLWYSERIWSHSEFAGTENRCSLPFNWGIYDEEAEDGIVRSKQ
jgi:hypothetical protein